VVPVEGPPDMPVNPPPPTAKATVALAGAGHIAAVHALAAAEVGLPVRWVASRTHERAVSLALQTEAKACTYNDLPAGVRLVIVATPPPWHVGPALTAIRGGATALVEKPLAATLADADRLVEAEQVGGRVHYGENLVVAPVFAAALDQIRNAGRLRHVEARLLMPRPDWGDHFDGAWGGGAMFDLGAHPVALALAAAGDDPALSVSARLERPPADAVDDQGELELTFASGLRAVVAASWRHHERVRDLHAVGDRAVVRAELLPRRSLEVDGVRKVLPDASTDPMAFRLQEFGFVAQLRMAGTGPANRAGSPVSAVRLDAAFGRRVLDVLSAAYASAGAGNAVVSLPFQGDRHRTPLALWRTG